MKARARLLAVLGIVAGGAIGVIASTQTWLDVTLADGGEHVLAVPGAAAVPVLAPLSLAALALGLALTVVGRALRYVFGAVAVAIGGVLGVLAWRAAAEHPVDAYASTVTEATGISGADAVAQLVAEISGTGWPYATLAAAALIAAGGAVALATAHTWRGSGRRYRTTPAGATAGAATRHEDGPRDAIDSWDDLSRGEDPTA